MKRYRIAGLAIDMEVGGRTLLQAEPYGAPVQGPADMVIQIDIDRILEMNPGITDRDMAEYLGTGQIFCHIRIGIWQNIWAPAISFAPFYRCIRALCSIVLQ